MPWDRTILSANVNHIQCTWWGEVGWVQAPTVCANTHNSSPSSHSKTKQWKQTKTHTNKQTNKQTNIQWLWSYWAWHGIRTLLDWTFRSRRQNIWIEEERGCLPYIGETGMSLQKRLTEHKYAVRNNDRKNGIVTWTADQIGKLLK